MKEHSSCLSNECGSSRPVPRSLIWSLVLAITTLVASQLVRLHQHQAASWLLWDYAGRIAALTVLAATPSARVAAFRTSKRQIYRFEIVLWILGICLLDRFLQLPLYLLDAAFPATVLGVYPNSTGWLKSFDLTFGLVLVAASEEIFFRQYIWHGFRPYLGNDTFAVLATSVLFGAYHWWSGLGNVLSATIFGIFFMLMLRRSSALWPVVLAHYLVDLIHFA